MCARVFLPVTPEELAELLDIDVAQLPPVAPRYNIAPGQDVLVARSGPDQGRNAALLRWGLVPPASKERGASARLINVRSESAARQPRLRDLMRGRRCLVPAAGFYEWKKEGTTSQPYAVRSRRGLVALGGVCDAETFTVLTTAANAVVAPIHDRMPVILEREQFAAWLDPTSRDADVHDLMRPYPAERLVAEPVSTRVNRPDNDDPLCLEPAAPPAQGRLF
jgi:putative SOS response-associated peptidase YedK